MSIQYLFLGTICVVYNLQRHLTCMQTLYVAAHCCFLYTSIIYTYVFLCLSTFRATSNQSPGMHIWPAMVILISGTFQFQTLHAIR